MVVSRQSYLPNNRIENQPTMSGNRLLYNQPTGNSLLADPAAYQPINQATKPGREYHLGGLLYNVSDDAHEIHQLLEKLRRYIGHHIDHHSPRHTITLAYQPSHIQLRPSLVCLDPTPQPTRCLILHSQTGSITGGIEDGSGLGDLITKLPVLVSGREGDTNPIYDGFIDHLGRPGIIRHVVYRLLTSRSLMHLEWPSALALSKHEHLPR